MNFILKGSNHFGIAGWYGMRALEQGLIVNVLCKTSISLDQKNVSIQ